MSKCYQNCALTGCLVFGQYTQKTRDKQGGVSSRLDNVNGLSCTKGSHRLLEPEFDNLHNCSCFVDEDGEAETRKNLINIPEESLPPGLPPKPGLCPPSHQSSVTKNYLTRLIEAEFWKSQSRHSQFFATHTRYRWPHQRDHGHAGRRVSNERAKGQSRQADC